MNQKADCHVHEDHNCSLFGEIICHLPYGVFSVALSFLILSFLHFFTGGDANEVGDAHVLFHSFHFMHIIFATTGAYLAFMRFSKNILFATIMSFASSLVFCTLSDILLPHLVGNILGAHIHLHLCITSEMHNVISFWAIGLVNALILERNSSASRANFTAISHFAHIFTSAMAALFYLVAEGFTTWYAHMGILFILLIVAVVVPCTLSDVIVPVLCGRIGKRNEKYSS